MPFLHRTTNFLKHHSPTQNMLKFMDIVLTDLIEGKYCQGNPEIQEIFYDQLNCIVNHLSFNMHEEVFPVFDKLLQISSDLMDAYTLKKCIHALVEANNNKQQVQKSKSHKQTIERFMKALLDANTQAIILVEKDDSGDRSMSD